MSDVVQPWPTHGCVGPKAGALDQGAERLLYIANQQPRARGGNEERRGVPRRRPVGAVQILLDRRAGSGVQRKCTGLVEFAVADGDQPPLGVEVALVERDGFADPHPGHDQQTDQGPIRRGPMLGAQPDVPASRAAMSSSV